MFRLFSKKKDEAEGTMTWIPLSNQEGIDKTLVASKEKPAIIFKHSTRCGISNMVLESFIAELKKMDFEKYNLYAVDVLEHRPASNALAEQLQVFHQSPQLLIVKNQELVHSSSHHAISAKSLENI